MKNLLAFLSCLLLSAMLFAQIPPDDDGDGVPNSEDLCPTTKGTKANRGCPEENKKITTPVNVVAQQTTVKGYQSELDKLNQYLQSFNDGYYGTFSVEKDSVYNRLKGGEYWYRFKAADIYGAEVDAYNKCVSIKCAEATIHCIMPSYGSNDGGDRLNAYIDKGRRPFNYSVMANLMNRFLFALKKQSIPAALVYDETIYLKTTTAEEDAIKNAKNPLDKALAEFNLAFKDYPYGNDEYINKIVLSEKRNVVTIEFLKRRPQLILDRIGNMSFENFGKKDPSIKFVSNKTGYCYCYEAFDCSESYYFTELRQEGAEKFYLLFGKIIDAWKAENNIKPDGLTFAEKFAKMKSPDFLWEIREGKTIQVSGITKNEAEYKKLKNQDGAIVQSGGLKVNSDLETYSGSIKTTDNKTYYVKVIKAVPQTPALVSRNIGVQSLGNGFFEFKDASIYNDDLFTLKKKVYHTNISDNRIEEIDFETGMAKAVFQQDMSEKIVTAAATDNYIYFATTNKELFSLYRFDPSANEIKGLINIQTAELKYIENSSTGEKFAITIKGFANRVQIYHSVSKTNLTSGFSSTKVKYYTIFDKDPTVRLINSRQVMSPDFTKFPFSYTGSVSSAGFNSERVLLNLYKDNDGKYQKLGTGVYNSNKSAYDSLKTYPLTPETMIVDEIFEANGDAFAIVSFWDDPASRIKRRRFFRLKENGQLTAIGNLGKGADDDYLGYFISGDELYIKSFSSLYRYTLSLGFLKEILTYDSNTVIRTDFYPTHNGLFIFEKFTLNPTGDIEKMLFDWKTGKAVPLTNVLNANPDIKAAENAYDIWVNSGKYNYVLKKTNDKRALYKLDFANNKAEQQLLPDMNNFKFKEIYDYKLFVVGNYIRLKAKYSLNNTTEEKYLVYRCE